MPFDGSEWKESEPTNNNLANEIDDYMRDDKSAVRSRLAHEHVMPSSQSATNEGGFHKYITFQPQTGTPGLVYGTNTQVGALFVASSSKALMFEDSAGSTFVIANSGSGVNTVLFGGTGSIGTIPTVTSGGGFNALAVPAATNSVLMSNGTTANPSYKTLTSVLVISSGQAAHGATIGLPAGVNSNEVQGIMVSIGDGSSAAGTSCPDGVYDVCSVNASRVVTARWVSINNGGVTGTSTANFVIIGVITH